MFKPLIRRRNIRSKSKKKTSLSIICPPQQSLETHLRTTSFEEDKTKSMTQNKRLFSHEKSDESEGKRKRKLSLRSWMNSKKMRMRSSFSSKSKKNWSSDYACPKCRTNKRINLPLKDEKGKWRNKWKKIFEILQILNIINQKPYRIRLRLMWLKTFKILDTLRS